MLASHARVVTDRPERYLRWLCQCLTHNVEVSFTNSDGLARFRGGICHLVAEPGALELHAEGDDEASIRSVEAAITGNLERLADSERLQITWERATPR